MKTYIVKNKHGELVGSLNFDSDSTAYDQDKTLKTLTNDGFKVELVPLQNLSHEQIKISNNKEFIKSKEICHKAIVQSGNFSFNIISITLSDVKDKFGDTGIELMKLEVPEIENYVRC